MPSFSLLVLKVRMATVSTICQKVSMNGVQIGIAVFTIRTHQSGTPQVPSMDSDEWRAVVPGGTSSALPAVQHEAVFPQRNSLMILGSAVR